MNTWLDGNRAAFDVETTGRDPRQARLVSASIVLVDANNDVVESHEWLADPGVEIPEAVTLIHGISTARARAEGAPIGAVVTEVAQVLRSYFAAGTPVMAFNAPYDFTVLAAECARIGVSAPTAFPVIDPFVLDKQVDGFRRGKRTLVAICEHYNIPLIDAHTSAADALATIKLAEALARRFPELSIPAEELHAQQIVWAAEQAASFQEYLRRTQADAVVDGLWPQGQL
ncbi:DNA polymerase III, epsilon chain [Renibacterium salmoninarum ATCC 33209]|uniref:DNA polymerase III, epsilon chain n=1 Tax=Renibacterium salmoninarum (strain ATCC 33209 / DSM 20767 / JCM 11484 / NBRC 15589 / NCIMB 2235) TaxID=288705 RepID=A9WPI5_RENSM|nr:3'-5' exonuclease [Renibacterium salmoninarum]ABY22970.1 DNA polymerase III, epsilon chain [Renibacterium salmoninarum ATCC 33209]